MYPPLYIPAKILIISETVTRHATVLNLVAASDTDESRLRARLGVEHITLLSGREIREKGTFGGLSHAQKIHAENGGGIFAIHSLDWSRQSQRDKLYALACMVSADKRVVIDTKGKKADLSWPGLIFSEFPRALRQIIAGSSLIGRITGEVDSIRVSKTLHRNIYRGQIRTIAYMRTDLWGDVKAGGSVGHVAGVINGIIKQGARVHILSQEKPPLLSPHVKFSPIEPSNFFTNERELALLAYNECLIENGHKALSESKPDAIYARYSLDCYAPVILADRLNVPLIVEYNGSEVWIEENWGRGLKYPDIAHKIENLMLSRADLITVVSRPLKDELLKRGKEEKGILVNPNSVDPSMFDPDRFSANEIRQLRTRLGIPEGKIVAGFIGTFSPWHGVEVIADVIPRAVSDNSRLHFLLIGTGPKFDEVKEKLRIADKLDYVTMTGLVPQDQAPKYLMCSDFFLSPHVPNPDGTPFFGSPTKLFEYMALGKGIIASDLDQIGEILVDGETGLLVKPGDSADLVKAIRRMCDDPELNARLGAAARAEALEKHTWKAHVARILDSLYNI